MSEIKYSIVIPAYNEGRRIEKTLEDIYSFFNGSSDQFEVIVVDDLSSGKKEFINDKAKYIFKDFKTCLLENNLGLKNIDVVFHLAAESRIQPSFEMPLYTCHNNSYGSAVVAEFARKEGCKVVYAGSSSRHHNPYQSPYALYKYLGEEICKMYKETYKMKVEIARFYNVYGPNEVLYGDWAAVIGIWRKQIKEKLPIKILNN